MSQQWFIGESHHKVDTKGRVSIPAAFRKVLASGDPDFSEGANPQVVVVYGDARRNYLECMTIKAMNKIQRKMLKMPPASPQRRALQKMYSTQALVTSVDETGRLVLPAKLRNKIGISNEAVFAGTGENFQIWSTETYEIENGLVTGDDDFDPDLDPSHYLFGDDEDEE